MHIMQTALGQGAHRLGPAINALRVVNPNKTLTTSHGIRPHGKNLLMMSTTGPIQREPRGRFKSSVTVTWARSLPCRPNSGWVDHDRAILQRRFYRRNNIVHACMSRDPTCAYSEMMHANLARCDHFRGMALVPGLNIDIETRAIK